MINLKSGYVLKGSDIGFEVGVNITVFLLMLIESERILSAVSEKCPLNVCIFFWISESWFYLNDSDFFGFISAILV